MERWLRDGERSKIDNQILKKAEGALRLGHFPEAKALLQAALDANPGDHAALRGLVSVCAALDDVDGAINYLGQLIQVVRRPLPIIDELARFCLAHSRLEVAITAYLGYLSDHPDSQVAHFNCAYYSNKLGRFRPAIDHYLKALKLGIDRPEEVHLNIANIHTNSLRDDTLARKHLEIARSINETYVGALFNLGNLAEQEGDLEEARRHFQRCLELDPQFDAALARLADTHSFKDDNDALLERLQGAAQRRPDPDLHFSAGRAHEQRQAYAEAWRHFTLANNQDRQHFPAYDPSACARRIDRIISVCNAEWVSRMQLTQPWEPLFICGMFRSGSTLVEQILAAHPAFTPAGEREFFPRLVASNLSQYPDGLESVTAGQLRTWADAYLEDSAKVFGTKSRLTDKRPDNFLYIGLIKAMFPKAKIVITQRDWRDVSLSIYTTRLGPLANYATDLTHVRHYIQQHDRLIAHWRSVFGEDLIAVQYERLIAEPRHQIDRLLRSLGESWDERCMDFHRVKNTVRTASVWQVRQPLYASSVGRWRHYREALVSVLDEMTLES